MNALICRYQSTGKPHSSSQTSTPCKTLLHVLLPWILAITVTTPQVFIQKVLVVVTKDPDTRIAHVCRESFPNVILQQVYTTSFFGLFFAIPAFIITGLLLRVGYALHKQTQPPENSTRSREEKRQLVDKRETARLVALLVTLFVVSWLPFLLYRILEVFDIWKTSMFWFEVVLISGFSTAASHPILFCVTSKNFKKNIREVMVKFSAKCGRRQYNMDLSQGISVLALSTEATGGDE